MLSYGLHVGQISINAAKRKTALFKPADTFIKDTLTEYLPCPAGRIYHLLGK